MLPVWLSDIRGFLLALVVTGVANKLGLVDCQPLVTVLGVICAAGLSFSLAFYVHTTRTVFNRRVNLSFNAYWQHLWLTRPLEALWRFLTAPFRVLPDFHILGEVRTGTTSMAAHLRAVGCIGPFSPWIIPLASDKESFYFVGHYLGVVHPATYRMCFPLKLTQVLRRWLYGEAPPVFDACASHLNAPWAAELIRHATPDAPLVVLLRPPDEQNVSWWRLEMGAHAWARGMGMGQGWLPEEYPPPSFAKALELSRSRRIEELYQEGERAAAEVLGAGRCGGLMAPRLPERLLPFPGGQLAAFAHMGRYSDNIKRYASRGGIHRMVFLETAELGRPGGVASAARKVGALVPSVLALQDRWQAKQAASSEAQEKLNASGDLPPELEPDRETLAELRRFYREDNQRLFDLLGRDLGWNSV